MPDKKCHPDRLFIMNAPNFFNKNLSLIYVLIFLLANAILGGCGQKGPLYVPDTDLIEESQIEGS